MGARQAASQQQEGFIFYLHSIASTLCFVRVNPANTVHRICGRPIHCKELAFITVAVRLLVKARSKDCKECWLAAVRLVDQHQYRSCHILQLLVLTDKSSGIKLGLLCSAPVNLHR